MINAPLVKIFELNESETLSPYGHIGYKTPLGRNLLMVKFIGFVVNVIDNPERNYTFIRVDDGTGQILVKFFGDDRKKVKNWQKIELWDVVLVLGTLKHWRDEIYIQPSSIIKLDFQSELYYRFRIVEEYRKILK